MDRRQEKGKKKGNLKLSACQIYRFINKSKTPILLQVIYQSFLQKGSETCISLVYPSGVPSIKGNKRLQKAVVHIIEDSNLTPCLLCWSYQSGIDT